METASLDQFHFSLTRKQSREIEWQLTMMTVLLQVGHACYRWATLENVYMQMRLSSQEGTFAL